MYLSTLPGVHWYSPIFHLSPKGLSTVLIQKLLSAKVPHILVFDNSIPFRKNDLLWITFRNTGRAHFVPWQRDTHDTTLSAVWWARDPEEPGAGANQGTAETADRTRTGTGPTPTLTARQGTQA